MTFLWRAIVTHLAVIVQSTSNEMLYYLCWSLCNLQRKRREYLHGDGDY